MKPVVFIVLLMLAVISSCKEKQTFDSSSDSLAATACGGSNPVETLPWLKSLTTELRKSEFCQRIVRATYKGQTVFISSICSPNVNSIDVLYDCSGKQLNLSADDYRNLTFTGEVEEVWRKD